MTRDEVIEGMEVKVLANKCFAFFNMTKLVPGDIVTLMGTFCILDSGKDTAHYYDSTKTRNSGYLPLEDIVPLNKISFPDIDCEFPHRKEKATHPCTCPAVNFTWGGLGCQCGGV